MADISPLRAGDPERLGAHRIAGRLGAGGQGTVFLGRGPDGRDVLGLKEAKDVVDSAPVTVLEGVDRASAESARRRLEQAGARVSPRPSTGRVVSSPV